MLEQLGRLDGEAADDLESETLEIKGKPRGRDELKRWLVDAAVCFANQRGGCLLVGIEDRIRDRKRALVGIGDVSYRGLERDVYSATDPHILIELSELQVPEGTLLAAHIPKGIPPHTTSAGVASIRVGKSCMPLTGSNLARMIASSGEVDLSAIPIEDASLGDLDKRAVERGRQYLRLQPGLSDLADQSDMTLLEALSLANGSELSQAAMLLFGKRSAIARYMPQHEVTILRYASSTRYDRRLDLRGPLMLEFEDIEDALAGATSLRTVRPKGFAQLEIPTLSWEVAREAILNAVAHRDYFLRQGVIVAIRKDHVEITSPGGFLGGISPANVLRHPPVHRNELLARSLQQLGLVNRVGLGVDRIFEGLLRAGSRPPTYRADEVSVSIMLSLGGSDEFAAWIVEHEKERGPLDLDDLIVLRRLMDAGSIDRLAASEHLQLNETDAANHLAEMRRRKLLVARGRGRATTYGLPRPLSERLRGRGVTDADRPLESEGVRLRILELLKERGRLTNAEIRDFSGYTRQQVLTLEKMLEHEGQIELHGHGRGAYITLTSNGGS
ncbi:MAG TPA: ATP-binding protein [Solirubrobacterales bacterium]|nr:ATP-binding protein [Solirubrobacterales bacterium]